MKPLILIISCEHAVSTIPPRYVYLFKQHKSVFETHRAIDFGAQDIAKSLSSIFSCDAVFAKVSRLLIDCNRSLTHNHCFSEFTKQLPPSEKQEIINDYYLPYREQAQSLIKHSIDNGNQVFHLSVHSFTAVLNGKTRNAAIGLLYDPRRHGEKEVAREWKILLSQQTPPYKVRMNYPYRGDSDGLTSSLRKMHSEKDYVGLELEINQALVFDKKSLHSVLNVLSNTLKELMQIL